MNKLKTCPFEEPVGNYEIEQAKKPKTNFMNITSSPEKLAEFMDSHFDLCGAGCSNCFLQDPCLAKENWKRNKTVYEHMVDWLKQETE